MMLVRRIGRGRKPCTWSDVYFRRANEIDYEQHALVDTRLEIPDTGREYRHSRQHARHYCGRIQSERGISKSDASQRRKVSHPHENRHSQSTTRRWRTRSSRALVSGGGKSQGRESVMKWSDAYGKARNRQRTVGSTRPRMSRKKKPIFLGTSRERID
jgi:hypothetical protein